MSQAIAPERTTDQRKQALQIANDIRMRRAQLKRDIKAGRQHPLAYLLNPPDWLETMRIGDLLKAIPNVGPARLAQILADHRVSHSRTLDSLTRKQREDIVFYLTKKGLR